MLGSLARGGVHTLAVPRSSFPAGWFSLASGVVAVDRRPRFAQQVPLLLAPPPSGRARTVRILNWNLLHHRRDNDRRLEVVARALEAEQPDMVALQEVSQSWFMRRANRAKVLATRLGFAWSYRGTNGIPKLWEEGLAV